MKLLIVSVILAYLCGCSHPSETISPPPAPPVLTETHAPPLVASTTPEAVLSKGTEEAVYKAILDANTRNFAEAQRQYHIPGNDEAVLNTLTHDEAKRLMDGHDAVLKQLWEKSQATICAKYHITPDTLERIRAKGAKNGWPKSQLSETAQKRLYAEWETGLTQIDERSDAKYPRPPDYTNDPALEKRRKRFEDRLEVDLKTRLTKKYHITEAQLEGVSMKALANNW